MSIVNDYRVEKKPVVPKQTVVSKLDAPGGFDAPLTAEDVEQLVEGNREEWERLFFGKVTMSEEFMINFFRIAQGQVRSWRMKDWKGK